MTKEQMIKAILRVAGVKDKTLVRKSLENGVDLEKIRLNILYKIGRKSKADAMFALQIISCCLINEEDGTIKKDL